MIGFVTVFMAVRMQMDRAIIMTMDMHMHPFPP